MTLKNCLPWSFLLLAIPTFADTLGFFEQRFNTINFDRGKWARVDDHPCFVYTALEENASIEVIRFGSNNLVPFKAAKGLKVTICGSTAAFDEGFQSERPAVSKPAQ